MYRSQTKPEFQNGFFAIEGTDPLHRDLYDYNQGKE
jgi:hypothetical protein